MFGFKKSKESGDSPPEKERAPSWAERLKSGLAKTRGQIGGLFSRAKIDAELLEELESTLLMADCGVEATAWLLEQLRIAVRRDKLETADELRAALAAALTQLLTPLEQPLV